MAYADQGMSTNRMIALGVVALLHVFLGYAFVTGLALKAVKVITGPMETVNIKEEAPPPEEPPPPPPKDIEIPPYVPPPEVTVESLAPPPPTITQQSVAPTPPQPTYVAPQPPAAPPAKPGTPARERGNPAKLFSTDDYPASSLRREEQGKVVAKFDVMTNGRITNCQIIQSVSPDLDKTTCRLLEARLRYDPATENGQPVVESGKTRSIVWQITPDR